MRSYYTKGSNYNKFLPIYNPHEGGLGSAEDDNTAVLKAKKRLVSLPNYVYTT